MDEKRKIQLLVQIISYIIRAFGYITYNLGGEHRVSYTLFDTLANRLIEDTNELLGIKDENTN